MWKHSPDYNPFLSNFLELRLLLRQFRTKNTLCSLLKQLTDKKFLGLSSWTMAQPLGPKARCWLSDQGFFNGINFKLGQDMVVLPVVYTAYTKLLKTVQCKISFRPFTKLTNNASARFCLRFWAGITLENWTFTVHWGVFVLKPCILINILNWKGLN